MGIAAARLERKSLSNAYTVSEPAAMAISDQCRSAWGSLTLSMHPAMIGNDVSAVVCGAVQIYKVFKSLSPKVHERACRSPASLI